MARWEPGSAERLRKAALELFVTQGFERTTAAQIAASAGLTQRTFFRHFSDKRDVLFQGQDQFANAFVAGLDDAPAQAPPMDLIRAALIRAARLFPNERRPYCRKRQSVIDADPALVERERHKLAGVAVEVVAALRARGVTEPAATLAAESGSTVFTIAFAQWLRDCGPRSLPETVDDVLDELRALSAVGTRADAP